ncbi:PAS domain-containing protein [Polyangium jinanense]|uniref:PAS domain-containing protein n=2 Tax=Polyangium jinanense TaxID=2829994 RepID=A0A9X3XA89_9BACT|nr:PAS domain-containing protein [Polyangium jinanense]MDC3960154.1 PAS domain-containing protein [Polyangium jinanense]MDC3986594.1 PAS domain-containing protein [Polyangium jinanense]
MSERCGQDEQVSLREEVERLRARLAAAERELTAVRAAETELRAMFTAMTDVVIVMNAEGRYLKIAPTGPDLLYKPSDDLLGRTLDEVMPPEMAAFFLSHVSASLAQNALVTMEYSLPIGDREVFFSANITPMSDDVVIVVARDITDRKRAEQALAEGMRRQAVIDAQEVALSALSTPLIPVTDEIVVMPLIGVLDAQRVQQVMETLLRGVTERSARTAILDITGISVVDTQVADAFVRAARAVQLLGAKVILTGVRRDVAQTLVEIQADLGGIVTRSTVQSGIAFAMAASY